MQDLSHLVTITTPEEITFWRAGWLGVARLAEGMDTCEQPIGRTETTAALFRKCLLFISRQNMFRPTLTSIFMELQGRRAIYFSA